MGGDMQGMLHSWEEEKSSAYLYRAMAEAESDMGHRVLFT
jgi:hypothetical protein